MKDLDTSKIDEKGDCNADSENTSTNEENIYGKEGDQSDRKSVDSVFTFSANTRFSNQYPTSLKKPKSQVELSMTAKQGFVNRLYQRAETMFRNGDWEQAMILYSRGVNLRPNMQIFKNGLRKTQDAITRSLDAGKSVDSRIEGMWRYTTSMSKKGLKRGLTVSETDVVKETCKKVENEDVSENILEIGEFVKNTAVNWRESCTVYAYAKSISENNTKKTVQEEEDRMERKKKAEEELKQTEKEIAEQMQLLSVLKSTKSEEKIHRTLEQLCRTKNRVLPNKMQCYFILYNFLTVSYINRSSYDQAKNYCEQLMKTAIEIGKQEYLCRAFGLMGKMYAAFGRYCWAIRSWESMIQITEDSNILSWVFHELGRCYFELDKMDTALVYARWSYESAKSSINNQWCLNALILMAHSYLHLGDNEEAMEAFRYAKTYAEDQAAIDYIEESITQITESSQISQLTTGLTCRRTIQLRVAGNPLVHIKDFRRGLQMMNKLEGSEETEITYSKRINVTTEVTEEEKDEDEYLENQTDSIQISSENLNEVNYISAKFIEEKLQTILDQKQSCTEENESQTLESERKSCLLLSDIPEETEGNYVENNKADHNVEQISETATKTDIKKVENVKLIDEQVRLAKDHEDVIHKDKTPAVSLVNIQKREKNKVTRNTVSMVSVKRKDVLNLMNSSRRQAETNIGDSNRRGNMKLRGKTNNNLHLKENKCSLKATTNNSAKNKTESKLFKIVSKESIQKQKSPFENLKDVQWLIDHFEEKKTPVKTKSMKSVRSVYMQNLVPKKSLNQMQKKPDKTSTTDKGNKLPKKKSEEKICNERHDCSRKPSGKTGNCKQIRKLNPEWVNIIDVKEGNDVNENLNFCSCGIGLKKNSQKAKNKYLFHTWGKKMQNCPCKKSQLL